MADSADVEEAGSPTVRGRTSSVGSNGSRRNSFTKLASDEDVKLEVTSTVEATVVKPASRRPGFFRRFIRDMAEGLDAAISLFEDEPVAPTVKLDPTLDGPKMEALRVYHGEACSSGRQAARDRGPADRRQREVRRAADDAGDEYLQ